MLRPLTIDRTMVDFSWVCCPFCDNYEPRFHFLSDFYLCNSFSNSGLKLTNGHSDVRYTHASQSFSSMWLTKLSPGTVLLLHIKAVVWNFTKQSCWIFKVIPARPMLRFKGLDGILKIFIDSNHLDYPSFLLIAQRYLVEVTGWICIFLSKTMLALGWFERCAE